jgi:tetratricopeptide (TPR) repeat protein
LGGAYRYRDETKKAIEAFEQAVRLDPRSSVGYTRLGELYSRQNLLLKAHEALTRAIELDPQRLEAQQVLARLFWRQDREVEALQSYARAAGLQVPDAPFAEELGAVFQKAHRPLEAAEYLRSALSQAEEASASLFVAAAETAKELNHLEDAAQILAVAMGRHPDVIDVPLLLADVKLAQGQRAQAKQLFERIVRQAPHTARGYFGLGQLVLEEGDVSGATRWLRAGLRYDPYNVHALETLHEERP